MSSEPPSAIGHVAEIAAKDRDASVVAGRYELLEPIGRGGTATVYRARDLSGGGEIALKRLERRGGSASGSVRELFEREFHTLANLAHPRVVEVHDYAIADDTPFYTMELLDGGDLTTLAPVEPRRACSFVRDVCSALCLVHSRRLLHRDISPRNVRCTTNGSAKLIDFGALAPMGASRQVIGTPPFCAPEVIELRLLDARTDLYSLGCTLYYTLTRRHAYPARDFQHLRRLWQSPAAPPSQYVELPAELDDLVMELIQLDPSRRPDSAAEVMQRLSAIAGLPDGERAVAVQAYLTTPTLVGRDAELAQVAAHLARARSGTGASFVVSAAAGLGRSRLMDACALQAKLAGFAVVRAGREDAMCGDYGASVALGTQLLELEREAAASPDAGQEALAPVVRELLERARDAGQTALAAPQEQRKHLQEALRTWFLRASCARPLAIVVDDVDELDEPSTALLALLAHEAGQAKLAVIAAMKPVAADTGDEGAARALRLLLSVSESRALAPLDRAATRALLGSMFGQVSHLEFVAERLHAVSGGNPRDLMELAQHLVDRGVARYDAGRFTLPDALDASDLPDSLARALRDRVAALPDDARALGQAFAFTPDATWSFEQCLGFTAHRHSGRVLSALDALLAAGVLRISFERYGLSQPGFAAALLEQEPPEPHAVLHERIADLHARAGDELRQGRHLLAAGQAERAVSVLVEHARRSKQQTDADPAAYAAYLRTLPPDYEQIYRAAIALCEPQGRPRSERYALQTRAATAIAADGDDPWDLLTEVHAQCRNDAGLDLHGEFEGSGDDPSSRLQKALAAAQQRYERASEADKVWSPKEALHPLVATLIEGIGIASRTCDFARWRELTSLAPLSPLAPVFEVVDGVRLAVGERLAGRVGAAFESYGGLIARLDQPDQAGMRGSYYEATRDGLICVQALIGALMGSPAVLAAAARLEGNHIYQFSSIQLRLLHHLWQGECDEAERYRKRFEVERVQANVPDSYESLMVFTELCALALSDDLARLQRMTPAVERWAARHRGFHAVRHFLRGEQHRIGGDFARALEEHRLGLACAPPGEHQLWPLLAAAEVRCLLRLSRAAEALTLGRRHQQQAERHGIDYLRAYIDMPVAMALAQTGETAAAVELARAVVAQFAACGASGVPVGLAHQVLARVCLRARDFDGFSAAAARCAEVFAGSDNRALVMKYERLLREARKALGRGGRDPGMHSPPIELESGSVGGYLTSRLDACYDECDRARLAANLLAERCNTQQLYLYRAAPAAPQLAAQVGEKPPPPELEEVVSQYLAAECERAAGATADLTTAAQSDVAADAIGEPLLADVTGTRYHATLLAHYEPFGYVITGVAVYGLHPEAAPPAPGRLAFELSRLALDPGPGPSRTVVHDAADSRF